MTFLLLVLLQSRLFHRNDEIVNRLLALDQHNLRVVAQALGNRCANLLRFLGGDVLAVDQGDKVAPGR